MFLPAILFFGGDGLPSLFLPLHPFPTIRRIVNFLAPRPGWVGWVCVLAMEVAVKGGQRHLLVLRCWWMGLRREIKPS